MDLCQIDVYPSGERLSIGLHVANPSIIDCPLGDGLALYDNRSGEYFSINGTAALMWRVARSPASCDDFLDALRKAPGAPVDQTALLGDVEQALRQFVVSGLFLKVAATGASVER